MISSLMLWNQFLPHYFLDYSLELQYELIRFLEPLPGAFAVAVFWGSDRYLTNGLEQLLKVTGTLHLFVISGSNIALVWYVIEKSLQRVLLKKQVVTISTISVLIVYVTMLQFAVPVARAFLMRAHSTIGLVFCKRRPNAKYSFALITILGIFFSPDLLENISFQFSYGAMAALLFVQPLFYREELSPLLHDVAFDTNNQAAASLFLGYVRDQCLAGGVVALLLAPLSLYYFGSWNVLGLIFTIICSPLVTTLYLVVLVCTMLLLTVPKPLFEVVSLLPIQLVHALSTSLMQLLAFFARIDWFVIEAAPTLAQLSCYFGVLGILLVVRTRKRECNTNYATVVV